MENFEQLIERLNSTNTNERISAAWKLRILKDKRAVEPLMHSLKDDKSSEVREAAAYSLGFLKDKRAVEPLIDALKNDKYSKVRCGAAHVLGVLKDKMAVEPLIDALKNDKYFRVKAKAIRSLRRLVGIFEEPKDTIADLMIHVLENDKSALVRAEATLTLGVLREQRALTSLLSAFFSDRRTRKYTLFALKQLNNPMVKHILISFYTRGFGISQSLLDCDVVRYKISQLETRDVGRFMLSIKKLSEPKIIDYVSKINGGSYNKEFNVSKILGLLLDNEEYFNILTKQGYQALKNKISKETGFLECYNKLSFIESVLKLEKEKGDENVPLLVDIVKEHKSIKNWMHKTKETKELINKMQNLGFNTNLYISSGETILEQEAKGRIEITDSWEESLENILNGLIKKHKYSIPGLSSKKLYSLIKENYLKFKKGDKKSALDIINKLLGIIKTKESYFLIKDVLKSGQEDKEIPQVIEDAILDGIEKQLRKITKKRRDLEELHDLLSGLKGRIETGDRKGTRLIAKVWRRCIPEDFYDNEKLASCMFKPRGKYKKEISLFLIDPKGTMLQLWNDVSEFPLGAAILYAGISDNKRAILLDTFEAGHSIYNTLGVDKTKQFVLDSITKFIKKAKAERLIIYNYNYYGRGKEFVDFVKKKYKLQTIEFEAVDEDEVLRTHSKEYQHHYTDAFGYWKPVKGKIKGYVIDLG